MSTESPLERLQTRIEELEARERRRSRTLVVIALAVAAAAGTAFAANGTCPNGLPFCFLQDTPAQAGQVNQNFMQLKEWVEAKTGVVSDGGIVNPQGLIATLNSTTMTTTTLNATRVNLPNCGSPSCLTGTNAAGNLHIDDSNATGGTYINWFSGGATVFGVGGQSEVGRIDSRGFYAGGHRTPSVVVTNVCNVASCTINCPAGTVVNMAFGLHGMDFTGNGGNWACGSGAAFMASCIGKNTCTVATGCGTSSMWAECW